MINQLILPEYKRNSILNLMSSIARGFGTKTKYKPLKLVKHKELKKIKNVVLIVVDGLGFEYLTEHGENSILKKYLKGKITSVFPSATTAAIPVFYTGQSCLRHEMVSWYSYIKEFGKQIIPLVYVTRKKPRKDLGEIYAMDKIFNVNALSDRINAQSYNLNPRKIRDTDFSIFAGGKAERVGYNNIKDLFRKIRQTIKSNDNRKYIHVYFSEHDRLCHDYGVESKKVLKNFKKFDQEFGEFLKTIKKTNTKIIITADHGEIDVPKNKKINLRHHPKLIETLKTPICGDHRYTFCFVKENMKKQFENYVKTKLGKYCHLTKSKDLVKKKFFGLEKPSKRFLERIGDYTLIAKEDYGFYQKIKGESKKFNISEHGGLSEKEMYVPLIVIDIK